MFPPKRIPGPFIRFIVAENANTPKVTTVKDGQARMAELAAKWRTLPEGEKEVFLRPFRSCDRAHMSI